MEGRETKIEFGTQGAEQESVSQAYKGTGGATRWTTRGSFPQNYGGYVTKCAPHQTRKLIARGKLTFDERVVLHRMGRAWGSEPERSNGSNGAGQTPLHWASLKGHLQAIDALFEEGLSLSLTERGVS